jgi:hypothetical protein
VVGRLEARQFRLTSEGVACGEYGFTVGGVALLDRSASGRQANWNVRPLADLDADLSERYGLAVDISRKARRIAVVAHALDSGDIALAQIAALLLQFPDPPAIGEQGSGRRALGALAMELISSDLLKGDLTTIHARGRLPTRVGSRPRPRPRSCPRHARIGRLELPMWR